MVAGMGIAPLPPLSRWYFHDFPSYSQAYFSGLRPPHRPSCPAWSGRLRRGCPDARSGVRTSSSQDDELIGCGGVVGCRDWRHGLRRISCASSAAIPTSSTATYTPTTSGWRRWRVSTRMVSPRLRRGSNPALATKRLWPATLRDGVRLLSLRRWLSPDAQIHPWMGCEICQRDPAAPACGSRDHASICRR